LTKLRGRFEGEDDDTVRERVRPYLQEALDLLLSETEDEFVVREMASRAFNRKLMQESNQQPGESDAAFRTRIDAIYDDPAYQARHRKAAREPVG
jgi:hypothetical protein